MLNTKLSSLNGRFDYDMNKPQYYLGETEIETINLLAICTYLNVCNDSFTYILLA